MEVKFSIKGFASVLSYYIAMMMRYFVFIVCFLVFAGWGGLRAETDQDFSTDVRAVEAYLGQLKTAQARFVQTTHDGTQLVGTFYLERPGKLRFVYDPPIEDFVVADGFFIYFYDAELGEQTNAPIGQTLADFFLREDLKLSGDVTVKHVKRGGDYLQMTLAQTADPEAGSLTLGFKEDGGLSLNKWRIVDAQGLITEIELFYLKTGITHSKGLFVYENPNSVRAVNE